MNNITIEKVKDILKCSIDETTNMNEAIEKTLQYIYLKGWNDAAKTGWISVSDGLPKKNMPCLVSVGKLYLTQVAMYSDLMGKIDHKIFYQGDYGCDNFEDITEYVKAWMPLPELYKAESEE